MKTWALLAPGVAGVGLAASALLAFRSTGHQSPLGPLELLLAEPAPSRPTKPDEAELARLKERLVAMEAEQQGARDAASALRFLDGWVAAQNAGDFERYQTHYAEDFVGVKRVESTTTQFNRAEWLADRKPMLERGATVTVARAQPLRRDGKVEVVFEQRWASSTFADVGTKALVLAQAGDGFQIVREEMLTSKLDEKARNGPCAKAYAALENPKGVRIFADISSVYTAEPPLEVPIVEVASQEDANRRAVDGFAWMFWATTTDGPWRAVFAFKTSPSGDWVRFTNLCFRGDGSLAEVNDSHRTFYSEDGLVNDTVTLAFSSEGKLVTQIRDAYLMETGKPARPDTYMRPPPITYLTTKQLPFKIE